MTIIVVSELSTPASLRQRSANATLLRTLMRLSSSSSSLRLQSVEIVDTSTGIVNGVTWHILEVVVVASALDDM